MFADFVNSVIEKMFLILLGAVELIGFALIGLAALMLLWFCIVYPVLRWRLRRLKG